MSMKYFFILLKNEQISYIILIIMHKNEVLWYILENQTLINSIPNSSEYAYIVSMGLNN